METVECLVIGAGVVGLAIARALAQAGHEVVIVEKERAFGTGISSRNSEVIHAGMYYPQGSAKARYCVAGNRMLRQYVQEHGVSHQMVGKLIVATNDSEAEVLARILKAGQANGVTGLRPIPAAQAMTMEPELFCTAALWSPDTGIVDTHGLMLSLLGEAENRGASIAYVARVERGSPAPQSGLRVELGGSSQMELYARYVVIAAGLSTSSVARSLGLSEVPETYLCKGNYFTLAGKSPFARLVYPIPSSAGLGVHYTLDLAGRGRFGPDVEWTECEDYRVDERRAESFYDAIRTYWPALRDGSLQPGYSGIRPKLVREGEPARDFFIAGPEQHGRKGVIALYGIESPGVTSSLAIAQEVSEQLFR
ncbi:MAG: NAD(P)/FAD-dependent oxidoreductase [Alphaproteobacteria bacterium]|nr:NAD(P)/FAD-dependent oxidoreductase [Alphaproteobacteria bacterium]